MMISLWQLMILGLIVWLVFSKRSLTNLFLGVGGFTRSFKAGLEGRSDIEVNVTKDNQDLKTPKRPRP